jgi:biopolymer transport protein ExbD
MLTRDELYVQGEPVESIADIHASSSTILEPLRAALKRPTVVGQDVTEKDLADREVTVMADKVLPYEIIKKVMATCTDADYGKVSFAVLQKDKPVSADALRPS